MNKEVVISTSGLNAYKFRVLTSGIDYTQYQRNPILLWMHNRPFRGTTDEVLPLGRMENLRVEDDKLIGTPVFDETDEFARKIKSKWDNGTLKMVSAGLDVIEMSDDPALLVQGQVRSTVTKSKLVEVSIVDIGANDDALVLSHKGKNIQLSAGNEQALDFMNIKQQIKPSMNKIALSLGLPAEATETEVLAAIATLKQDAAQAVALRKEKDEMANKAIEQVVNEAIQLRKFTADKKDHFVAMGKSMGLESLQETLNLMKPEARPTDAIHLSNTKGGYTKLSEVPLEQLETLRKEDYDTYRTLYRAEYGIEPEEA